MCVRIKLSDNKSYAVPDVLRASFPNKKFPDCPFLRRESIKAVWAGRIINKFSIPVRGHTERMMDGTLEDFEQAGKMLVYEVRSPLDGTPEIRIVTRTADNGSLHRREPIIEQSYAQTASV